MPLDPGLQLLRELPLKPWASCRREDLLGLLTMLNEQIGKLDAAVERAAEENRQAKLLMTQPGVGPNTALAFVLTIGDVRRFPRGKQVASYLGLIPREEVRAGDRSWVRSPNKAIACCAHCWWKPRRWRCAAIRDCASSICTAVIKNPRRWRKWPSPAN
jgi:transposase